MFVSYKSKKEKKILILRRFGLLFLLAMTFLCDAVFAKDRDYGCPYRRPGSPVTQKEIGEYVMFLDYVFDGKPIRRRETIMGFQITTFKIEFLYRGEMPENRQLDIVHTKDMFTDMEGVYLVRGRIAKDKNIFPDGMSCPKYYTDEEVVSHIKYFWQRFLFGFFILLFGVFLAMKFFNSDHEYAKKFAFLKR